MSISIINLGNCPYQPCWGCGEPAGGFKAVNYGNFPLGVQHITCGERIRNILNRSLRALAVMDNECDASVCETVKRALITSSARQLNNKHLNQINEDTVIRHAVETTGLQAALSTLRSLSTIDNTTWENRLKDHKKIMEGPELEQKEISEEEENARLVELPKSTFETIILRKQKWLNVLESILTQLCVFIKEAQGNPNSCPYYIIKEGIKEYDENSSELDALRDLFRDIEEISNWKIVFLAEEVKNGASTHITHIFVGHVALISPSTSIIEAEKHWKTNPFSKVFPLECLDWKNHWVFLKEVGYHLSVGDGSKQRPSL